MDLLIRGGMLCDGTHAGAVLDVGIANGRIAAVGRGLGRARTTIDVAGCLVTPGFIDMHTHSDFTLPLRPTADAKLLQGVTTDVTGNCGFSPFPLTDADAERGYGNFFEPALGIRWNSLREYAAAVNSAQPAINIAPLVGLGAIRLRTMGDSDRPATARELREMRRLVDEALADGAFGVSSGLVYPPGSFADTGEITFVAEPLARRRGLYASHIRNEADHLEEAVEEALTIGARIGCAVQLSHHKCLGQRNWGRVKDTLARIDAANRDGGDVHLDVYPYTAGSSTLASLLPGAWDGGVSGFRSRSGNPDHRLSLIQHAEQKCPFALADVVLAEVPSYPELQNRRLLDAASSHGVGGGEMVVRLLEQDGFGVVIVAFGMDEQDVRRVLRHPHAIVGSDGWIMSRDAVSYAHPRNFACTVRLLSRYVRDEPVLQLKDAVRKMTAAPAARLGLCDRGRLMAGAVADIVVLRLDNLEERSTFETPCVYPTGVEHVFVAAEHVVENGKLTGRRPGRVLLADREMFV